MKIEATFKGDDGSLGYRANNRYVLKVDDMEISRIDGTGKCVYDSLKSFLRNWSSIIVIN